MIPWVSTCYVCSARYSNIALKHLSAQLHLQVQQHVEHCYEKAEAYFGRRFPRPALTFRRSGKNAGTAFLQQNRINFHPILLSDNAEIFKAEVIPHEVSHLLVWQLYGKVKPHGAQWQAMMRDVFGCMPNTTHSFDTSRLGAVEFAYRCDCDTIMLSRRRHNTVLKGGQYRCGRCKQLLKRALT